MHVTDTFFPGPDLGSITSLICLGARFRTISDTCMLCRGARMRMHMHRRHYDGLFRNCLGTGAKFGQVCCTSCWLNCKVRHDVRAISEKTLTLLLLMSGPVRRDLPTLRGAASVILLVDFMLLTREEGADPTLPDVIVADPGPPVLLCSRLLKLVFGPYL